MGCLVEPDVLPTREKPGVVNPKVLLPYRVEWRPYVTNGWLLIAGAHGHEKARQVAADTREKHGGQTRIVTQHVIEAEGLGGREF
jgi:hypothetical protein